MVSVDVSNCDVGTFQPSWFFNGIDDGQPVRIPQYSDKSYGMWGTWGGGTVVLEGSWDKSNPPAAGSWITLYESNNSTAISNTANAAGMVIENPIWIRARCSVAATAVRVTLNCCQSPGAKL